MAEAADNETMFQRAAQRLAGEPGVIAVYAFGSRTRDHHGAGSDIDLAVYLDQRVDLRTELRLRASVVEELRRDDVDLVILNNAPPLLAWEVVTTGRRLFSRDAERSDEFEDRTIIRFLDTAYLRRMQHDLIRESVR